MVPFLDLHNQLLLREWSKKASHYLRTRIWQLESLNLIKVYVEKVCSAKNLVLALVPSVWNCCAWLLPILKGTSRLAFIMISIQFNRDGSAIVWVKTIEVIIHVGFSKGWLLNVLKDISHHWMEMQPLFSASSLTWRVLYGSLLHLASSI